MIFKNTLLLVALYLINESYCLFDKQIFLEKPLHGSCLFFRKKNQNEFIISNSKTSYLINIRTGKKEIFPAVIPFNSTIYEPYLGYWHDENNALLVDSQTKENFIKIYDLKNNEYHEYKDINSNNLYKIKYEYYNNDYFRRFIVAFQDNDDNLR